MTLDHDIGQWIIKCSAIICVFTLYIVRIYVLYQWRRKLILTIVRQKWSGEVRYDIIVKNISHKRQKALYIFQSNKNWRGKCRTCPPIPPALNILGVVLL